MSISIHIEIVDHTTPTVAHLIYDVQMHAYAQEALLLGVSCFPPLRRTVDDVLASSDAFLAAFVERELVGVLGLSRDTDRELTSLNSLVVSPKFQRRGIALALLKTALAASGRDELIVQTGAKNLPALALYAQFGFVEMRRWVTAREAIELVQLRRVPQ